ncbi:MBL fold metallo-hydrolase [Candidatus Woesearchaeota archaeon]|nr:MBL fold metallo-hydrolase [Candidatus Woesearchaeota archaeon]
MSQPKLIFLGTGGDAIVVGKQMLSSGGMVLQVEDNQIHIDPGPGAVARAADYGINLRNNVALCVSHNHINHANDVNAVISSMTHGGLDRTGVLITNKSAYEDNMEMQPMLNRHFKDKLEKDIVLDVGKRVGINEVEIRATHAEHTDPHTIGFKFFTPNFTMGYSSDTSYTKEMVEDYREVDLMVLNCLSPGEKKIIGHLNTEDVKKLLPEIRPKLAIITHFGVKMLETDIINEARQIQHKTGVQTIAAKDGMVLNPLSYSVNLRQKTLNLFKKQ